ncbi:MAG TPA: hypothetical protein VGQ81_07060, partial [Acidobacteriota bacterium]|nr:hypothetical protein [Acidobacteriota bacterium]
MTFDTGTHRAATGRERRAGVTLCDYSSAELLQQRCGRSDFASLIAMTQSGAPLPSGRGSVGAATKPAAADHAPLLDMARVTRLVVDVR